MQHPKGYKAIDEVLDELPEDYADNKPSPLKDATIEVFQGLTGLLFTPFSISLLIGIAGLFVLHLVLNWISDPHKYVLSFCFFVPMVSGFFGDLMRGHLFTDFRVRLFLFPIMTIILGSIPLFLLSKAGYVTIAYFVLFAPQLTFGGAIVGAVLANLIRNFCFARTRVMPLLSELPRDEDDSQKE